MGCLLDPALALHKENPAIAYPACVAIRNLTSSSVELLVIRLFVLTWKQPLQETGCA